MTDPAAPLARAAAARAGLWRAAAAHQRDEEAPLPDWNLIDAQLRASYRALRAGMESAPSCEQSGARGR